MLASESEKDLKKFYKNLLTCDHCKRKYGSDAKDETPMNLCPICNHTSTVKRITENAIKD
jgi:rRNA maturation endonuclease Nob1